MDTNYKKIDTAVILCGGESKRAGMDKQMLTVDNMLIVVFIAEKLKAAFSEIVLVTNKPWLYEDTDYNIVEDIYKGVGPLGGIHSGLLHANSDMAYVTACDMPNVSIPYIEWLKNKLGKSDNSHDVVVVKWDTDEIEPFNGFYSKNVVPVIEQAVENKVHKITDVYKQLRTLYIEEEDIKQFNTYRDIFLNINWSYEIDDYKSKIRMTEK